MTPFKLGLNVHPCLRIGVMAGLLMLMACRPESAQQPDAEAVMSDGGPEASTTELSGKAKTYPYSPPLRSPDETRLYWGDLHLHTNLSFDAYIQGTVQVSQEDAYRFAMGQTVTTDTGVEARLRRPLDFLAVTDHAQNMGLFARIDADDPLLEGTPVKERWSEILWLSRTKGLRAGFMESIRAHGMPPALPDMLKRQIWRDVTQTADAYNRPGYFTAMIGYEWTSNINGDNLHRVVLYRDDADKAGEVMPFSAQDSSDPEDLWTALAEYEETGGKVLAIPHNGNISNGRMFSPDRLNGEPIDARYAQSRARWEPVYEVTQVKGDGEAHPVLSPTDEFADFETWDRTNASGSAPKEDWMLQFEYARSALREGLRHERDLGVNPFKFGMIGSTDSHTGLSTNAEGNYFGKYPSSQPSADRYKQSMSGGVETNWELGASGLAAVWAVENTRAALFDAIKRREVYSTTGSRIRLRFFGGWNFEQDDINRPDYARFAYRNGVPMGGDLPGVAGEGAPRFLIHAARDPEGANLDRIQVVKGWIDAEGETHEAVFDVALSDGRVANGDVALVGSTVNTDEASYRNSIGDPELAVWWEDPDFDPSQAAFYYVRVLEIPTPRWTAYDQAYFGVRMGEEVTLTVQDRAYSSPIWYRP